MTQGNFETTYQAPPLQLEDWTVLALEPSGPYMPKTVSSPSGPVEALQAFNDQMDADQQQWLGTVIGSDFAS